MAQNRKLGKLVIGTMAVVAALGSVAAKAEVSEFSVGIQNGLAYTPFMVMRDQKLVEKHAKVLGVEVSAKYVNLQTPDMIQKGLIGNQVQFGGAGPTTLIQMAESFANGQSKFDAKTVGAVVAMPIRFVTTEDVTSFCDVKGRIAVTALQTSVQALNLEELSDKFCGNPKKLDKLTVGMKHPLAMQALLTGAITTHFGNAPFDQMELDQKAVKTKSLVSSYQIAGKKSFIYVVGSEAFRVANPKVQQAFVEAFEEAQEFVNSNRAQAAEIYIRAEKPMEDAKDILAQFNSPEITFSTTPVGLEFDAYFMFDRTKVVTHKFTLKDLAFPNLWNRKGS